MFELLSFILVVVFILFAVSLKQINEYERAVLLTMGRYTSLLEPGWRFVMPGLQFIQKIDIRTKVIDIPKQETITSDNISCKVNAVLSFCVVDSRKALLEVERVFFAVSQVAQTTMRKVIGEVTLNELLSNREELSKKILENIEKVTVAWGIDVLNIDLKDIELPESMMRMMAKQAEAERERKATIIHAEGEVIAAENLAKAAELMSSTPGALHLRTLNTLNDISGEHSKYYSFCYAD